MWPLRGPFEGHIRRTCDPPDTVAGRPVEAHWLVMDAVGYLPPPGKRPLFGRSDLLARLDDWLDLVMRDPALS